MEKEYKRYSELPTMFWLIGALAFAIVCLVVKNLFDLPEPFSLIILSVGIIMFSILGAVFIVALIFPILASVFPHKNKNRTDLLDDSEIH